ncbi:helix-turn-helix domain-containing protein [Streptomyces sp. NPDC001858]
MSHLWSGRPLTVRLADLDIICEVLDCTTPDLLIPREGQRPAGDHNPGGGEASRRRQPDHPAAPAGSLGAAAMS